MRHLWTRVLTWTGIEPRGFTGEMALLEETPRSASAEAAEQSNVFLLHKNKLEGLMVERPTIGMAIREAADPSMASTSFRVTSVLRPCDGNEEH